jgi:hypothetical protein
MSQVRGFNYSGSWGTSGLDLWQHHDNGTMAVEVARGKSYFPRWNVVRWWLSHDAFHRSPDRFLANFEAGLAIFARHDLRVIPVLFNRWRAPECDFGGVSLDQIVPRLGGLGEHVRFSEVERSTEYGLTVAGLFAAYLEQVVGTHRADERIFAWDLCNEPSLGAFGLVKDETVRDAELDWLTWCRDVCKACGAGQPLTIGNLSDLTVIEMTEPITDLISFHPYYTPNLDPDVFPFATMSGFEDHLENVISFAAATGKDLLATETVWGALDDGERVTILRYTLGELVRRKIGFIVHALHHSLVADLHAPEYGPVGVAGRLEFINADGSLRGGHEAFNEFAAE